jgi:hypothetical protein
MGQYYRFIFLSVSGAIVHWINSNQYEGGSKMMEFAWIGNELMVVVESVLAGKPCRIVCAGDYGAPEGDNYDNLYELCYDVPDRKIMPEPFVATDCPYIVNHTKKLYVNKNKNTTWTESTEWKIHPLALLVSESDSWGGGDYSGAQEMDVGSWARDSISMESTCPGSDYTELVVGFAE